MKETEPIPGIPDTWPSKKDIPRPSFPVENWERFEFISYLGGGGMGKVYKGYDISLDRMVALKFLADDSPRRMVRFQKEALAQARLDHECICKVYEVGEVQDKFFIAMQYIDGQQLNEIAQDMNLEQKLIVMRDICWAVHEAHRKGLIHRDIKPGNIMVESREDGSFHPYVMDFGLAKEIDSGGMTVTGVVMGTPHYMSPEQARGDNHLLDRRTDVYSLGATLYEVLMGETPFEDKSYFQFLLQLQNEMPKELEKESSKVPKDVQIILSKCMMKEPNERYASARELAEDIARFLDGEPIKARPASLMYKLKMRIRKNKLAFAVGAIASVAILLALSWGVYTRVQAGLREEMIQAFSEKVENMEAIARYSHMMPIHDISADQSRIQLRIEEIRFMMAELGKRGMGPGNYALGRGFMALNEMETARQHLESAWDGGYRDPRVAYALGRVLAEQYRKKRLEVAQIADPDRRDWEKKQIAKTWRDPAIGFLDQATGVENESPEYVDALLLHMKEEHERALEAVKRAYLASPWMYEAHLLEGDINVLLGKETGNKGHYDLQDKYFGKAEKSYQVAAKLARSDVSVRLKQIYFQRMKLAAMQFERKGDSNEVFQKARLAYEHALKLDPDDWKVQVEWCEVLNAVFEVAKRKGEPAIVHLERSIEHAEGLLTIQNSNFEVHMLMVDCLQKRLGWLRDQGKATDSTVERIEHHLNRSRELTTGPSSKGALQPANQEVLRLESNFYVERALALMQDGLSPVSMLEKALSSMKLLQELNPQAALNMSNIGIAYFFLARYQSFTGEDPTQNLELALAHYEKSMALNSNSLLPYNNFGEAAWVLAEYEMNQGKDPRPTLNRAVAALERAVQLRDDFHTVYDGLATTHLLAGIYDFQTGQDPWPSLESAIKNYQFSRSLNSKNMHVFANLGECYWVYAKYLDDLDRDASEIIEKACVWYSEGQKINPSYYYSLSHFADSYWLLAKQRHSRGLDPGDALKHGMELINRAIDANSNDYWSFLVKSKLELLWFRSGDRDAANRTVFLGRAESAIERALELHPGYSESHLQKSEVLFEKARESADTPRSILPALRSVDKALEIKPNLAEAWFRKASFLTEIAIRQHREKDCQQTCKEARQCFSKSLELKPSLKTRITMKLKTIPN